jgi:diphthamide synthase (EF-2-diphthine--ammonia ligase)
VKQVAPRVRLSWSSGKDSAWALHIARQQAVEVVGLLTTFNEAADRVAMHAVRRALVEDQAKVRGPAPCGQCPCSRRAPTPLTKSGCLL